MAEQQERDSVTQEYCNNNQIKLLVIRYYNSYRNFDSIFEQIQISFNDAHLTLDEERLKKCIGQILTFY